MFRAAIMVPLTIQHLIDEVNIQERDRMAFYELTALRSDSGALPSIGLIACHWFGALRPAGSIQRAEAIMARLVEAGLVARTAAGIHLAQPQLYLGGSAGTASQTAADTELANENAEERRRRQAADRKRRQRQRDSHAPNVTPERDKKPVASVTGRDIQRDNSVTCHAPGFPPHTPSFLDLSENKTPLPPCHSAERDIRALSVTPEFDFEGLAAELVAAHPSPRPGRRNNLVVSAICDVWSDAGGDVEQMELLRVNGLAWCAHWREQGYTPNLARWIREYGWLTGPPAPKPAQVERGPNPNAIDWASMGVAS